MEQNIKIAFIGSGNVAWHLSQVFENTGFPVVDVYSRDIRNAEKLAAKMYDSGFTDKLDLSSSEANLFIICVNDDAIPEVCNGLVLPEHSIVVHTSGSQPLDILRLHQPSERGVFYPLQTFSKNRKIDLQSVPFCLEAEKVETEELLVEIAQKLSKTVYLVSSYERRILHIAAVFACNFTNHLMALAKQVLDHENLEFDLLKPLIRETIQKALDVEDPAEMQTGPAKRKDIKLIQSHLSYLQNDINKEKIYRILSESIIKAE